MLSIKLMNGCRCWNETIFFYFWSDEAAAFQAYPERRPPHVDLVPQAHHTTAIEMNGAGTDTPSLILCGGASHIKQNSFDHGMSIRGTLV